MLRDTHPVLRVQGSRRLTKEAARHKLGKEALASQLSLANVALVAEVEKVEALRDGVKAGAKATRDLKRVASVEVLAAEEAAGRMREKAKQEAACATKISHIIQRQAFYLCFPCPNRLAPI